MKGTTLSNQVGTTLTGRWVLDIVGTNGTIQNVDAGVNGYLSVNNNTASGSAVVEEALDDMDDGQKWIKSADDDSGYFTLMNPKSGKFLTANYPKNTLTIEGNALVCFVCIPI